MNQFERMKEGLRAALSVTPEELKEMKRNERKAWRDYGRAECREERRQARAQARIEKGKRAAT